MALATQCPHCQTAFRVANDQLKLRGGLVRCGSCREVFNGIEHLVRPDPTAPVATLAPETAPAAVREQVLETDTAIVAAADQPLPAANSNESVDSSQTASDKPVKLTLDRVEAAIDDLEEDLRIAEETSQSAPADVHHTPFGLIKPSAPTGSGDEASGQPTPNVWHRHVDDDEANQMARMTLMHVAGQDYTLAAHAKTESKNGGGSAEDDDELDRIIDELQRKPWRKEKHAASPAALNATEISENSGRKKNRNKLGDPEQSAADEPDFVLSARRKQRIAGALRWTIWSVGALLLIGLIGQSTYFFRDQLAARMPQLKPLLAGACAKIGCSVGLPMKIDSISIDANELQALDPARNIFSLNLLLRNRSDIVQAWPNIELTLNDASDKAIVRRVFTPHDYLSAAANPAQGFSSDQEQAVKLTFELLQLKASGYRVYLYYP